MSVEIEEMSDLELLCEYESLIREDVSISSGMSLRVGEPIAIHEEDEMIDLVRQEILSRLSSQ